MPRDEAADRKRSESSRYGPKLHELESMAFGVAHDLQAKIRAIHGFAEILALDYADQFDLDGKNLVRSLLRSADRAEDIIRDVLAYGRLGRMEIQLVPIELDHVVSEVVSHLDGAVQASDLQVAHGMPTVLGHHALLNSALENLMSNALKYRKPDSCASVRVAAETHGSRVRIVVSDEGIGIEPSLQSKLFSPFVRLHSESSYPGTGLGLALVRKAAERMGGSVGVISTPGVGSSFWVDLALADRNDDEK